MTGPQFKPIYTTYESVKVRLANKVQFQSEGTGPQDGEIPDELLGQLIVDAETQVEQDLRGRYAIPFQSKRTGSYKDLPDHSKRALRVAVDMMAVVNILNTDFGAGGHTDGEKYSKNIKTSYDAYINKLLGRDQEAASDKRDRFRFSPPLDDVLLSPTNRKADDGYKGMIINTDASNTDAASYAEEQVNNPARSYVRQRGFGGL